MKKLHLVYIITALATMFIVVANSFETSSYVSGPPAGRCGDPASGGLTCTSCHSATLQTVSGWITSDIPVSGYVPGQTYTVTATATQSGLVRFGFQISPQNLNGDLLGTLVVTNTTETQLVGSSKYIEHKSAGTTGSGGSKTWTFNWIAPVTGTGDVTFYGAFNCANNNGGSGGDNIYKTTYTISECQATAQITSTLGNNICNNITTTLQANNGNTFQWSNGSTTSSINAAPGSYAVTVTQTDGCSATSNITINATSPPTVTLLPTNTLCADANGNITLNISSGTGPFTYTWSNGATTQNISNLVSGVYTVTVNDAAGCAVAQSVTVGSSTVPSISVNTTDAACGQSNGAISSNVNSGTPPYSYVWSNGATTSSIDSIPANTYTVIVADANSCTVGASVIINNLQGPDITGVVNDATCGNANGAIDVTVSGGAPPYVINGDFTSGTANLASGTYSTTVSDANGCITTQNYLVEQLSSPVIGSIVGDDSVLVDSTYSYHINPQANSTILNWNVTGGQLSGQGNASITVQWDLIGTHLIIVSATDTNGCLVADTLTVNVDAINALTIGKNFNHTLSLYPNPSITDVTLSMESNESTSATLSILSFDGRILFTDQFIVHQGVNRHNISVSDLSPGSYVLRLKTGNAVQVKRMSILR